MPPHARDTTHARSDIALRLRAERYLASNMRFRRDTITDTTPFADKGISYFADETGCTSRPDAQVERRHAVCATRTI